MGRRSIQEVSEDTLILTDWLKNAAPDQDYAFLEITQATGIAMDRKGKDTLRRASRRASVEYSAIKGFGIRLAGPRTGLSVVAHHGQRIKNTVRRGERAFHNVSTHRDGMQEGDRRLMDMMGAGFAAINVATEQARKMFSQERRAIGSSPVQIPRPAL